MGLTKWILKFAAPVPKPEQFTRYLFVGPHPDDIEIGAGATVAKLVAKGKQVTFVICLDGRFGSEYAPEGMKAEELIALRKQEAIGSAAHLGVTDVRFLDLCDGGFYEKKDLIKKLAAVVAEVKPDIIFAPDPSVSSECHIDHRNVGEAARQIACFAPYGGIMKGYDADRAPVEAIAFYMTAKPNRYVGVAGYQKRQLEAIFSFHTSQFPVNGASAKSITLYLKLRGLDFGLRSLKGKAEGFRVLGTTHMHCLPDV